MYYQDCEFCKQVKKLKKATHFTITKHISGIPVFTCSKHFKFSGINKKGHFIKLSNLK